MTTTLTWV